MAVAVANANGASSVSGKLVVPPADAGPWVFTQIERGLAIRKMRIRSTEELEKARARKGEWVTQTHDLLMSMFDTDAVAVDFNEWDVRVLPDYADTSEFAELFYEEMDQRLTKLRSIHRRIPPPAMASTLPTAARVAMETKPDGTPADPAAAPAAPPEAAQPTMVGQQRCLLVGDGESNDQTARAALFLQQLGFNAHVMQNPGHNTPPRLPLTVFAVFVVSAPPTTRLAYELGLCAGRCGTDRVFVLAADPAAWATEMGLPPIAIDESELWQLQLARQLKRGGVDVDLNRLA